MEGGPQDPGAAAGARRGAKAEIKSLEQNVKEANDRAEKEWDARTDLEYEIKKLREEVARLKARRGAAVVQEKEEEESPVMQVYEIFAEDRQEVTSRLGKIEKTMKGVVEVLGMLANAIGGVAISKSPCATPSGGCKRKHDGRGGDRKSALYKLKKQMGPTAAPQLK